SIGTRQRYVEQRQVEVFGRQCRGALAGIGRTIHRKSRPGQPAAARISKQGIILDHQDAHTVLVLKSLRRAAAGMCFGGSVRERVLEWSRDVTPALAHSADLALGLGVDFRFGGWG